VVPTPRRVVQGAALVVCEVIAFIIRDKVDDGSVGRRRPFVEDQPSVLDACSKRNSPGVTALSARAPAGDFNDGNA